MDRFLFVYFRLLRHGFGVFYIMKLIEVAKVHFIYCEYYLLTSI